MTTGFFMRYVSVFIFLFFFHQGFSQSRAEVLNVVMEDLDGKKYELHDFIGKVIYIDMWASWCLPCRWEFPKWADLKKEYKDKDVVFIGLSIDHEHHKWVKYITKKEKTKGQYIGIQPSLDVFEEKYGIYAVPHFILIDKRGNVFENNTSRPSSGETINIKLDKLLAE